MNGDYGNWVSSFAGAVTSDNFDRGELQTRQETDSPNASRLASRRSGFPTSRQATGTYLISRKFGRCATDDKASRALHTSERVTSGTRETPVTLGFASNIARRSPKDPNSRAASDCRHAQLFGASTSLRGVSVLDSDGGSCRKSEGAASGRITRYGLPKRTVAGRTSRIGAVVPCRESGVEVRLAKRQLRATRPVRETRGVIAVTISRRADTTSTAAAHCRPTSSRCDTNASSTAESVPFRRPRATPENRRRACSPRPSQIPGPP